MRTPKIVLLGVAVLLSCCVHPRPQARASLRAQSVEAGEVVGVVYDVNDALIVGATIRVEGGGLVREVRSDDEGEFAIELPAGAYRLTAEKGGFRRYRLSLLRVRARARKSVRVRMREQEPRGLQKLSRLMLPMMYRPAAAV